MQTIRQLGSCSLTKRFLAALEMTYQVILQVGTSIVSAESVSDFQI
jgi:hypothetical protein